jgi:hypothetical protein
MTMSRRTPVFNPLDRLLLKYAFGAALGAAALVAVFRALGWPGEVALFLVPAGLGWHLITRAYRTGQQQTTAKDGR